MRRHAPVVVAICFIQVCLGLKLLKINVNSKYSRVHYSRLSDNTCPRKLHMSSEISDLIQTSPSSMSSNSVATRFYTVWQFTRPHTVVGSFISILSLYMYAYPFSSWLSPVMFKNVIFASVPSLFMNIYITGLNQIFDINIDRINKPYLPLASGALSFKQGLGIVISSLILSFITSISAAWPLKLTLLSSFVLGTIYSIPGFRLKRFPILAALSIIVVRGTIVNLGFYFNALLQLGFTGVWFQSFLFIYLFIYVYGCCIIFIISQSHLKCWMLYIFFQSP